MLELEADAPHCVHFVGRACSLKRRSRSPHTSQKVHYAVTQPRVLSATLRRAVAFATLPPWLLLCPTSRAAAARLLLAHPTARRRCVSSGRCVPTTLRLARAARSPCASRSSSQCQLPLQPPHTLASWLWRSTSTVSFCCVGRGELWCSKPSALACGASCGRWEPEA